MGHYEWKTVRDALKHVKAEQERGCKTVGIPTGLRRLDEITGGLRPGTLTLVGGRPHSGKTEFMMQAAGHAAVDKGIPVALFSREMSAGQVVTRLVGQRSRLHRHLVACGKLKDTEWKQLTAAVEVMSEAPIYIQDSGCGTLAELEDDIRSVCQQHHVQLVWIDYLQLLTPAAAGTSRKCDYAAIMRALKNLTEEFEIAIVINTQLPRSIDARRHNGCRPYLSDVLHYGPIEQDTDMVIFIYREDVMHDADWPKTATAKAELIVAKSRFGADEMVCYHYHKEAGLFEDV